MIKNCSSTLFIQLDTQLQAKVAQHLLDIGHPLILVLIHIIVRWHVNKIALLNPWQVDCQENFIRPEYREGQWIAIELEEEGDQIGHSLFLKFWERPLHIVITLCKILGIKETNVNLISDKVQGFQINLYIVFGLKLLINRPNQAVERLVTQIKLSANIFIETSLLKKRYSIKAKACDSLKSDGKSPQAQPNPHNWSWSHW